MKADAVIGECRVIGEQIEIADSLHKAGFASNERFFPLDSFGWSSVAGALDEAMLPSSKPTKSAAPDPTPFYSSGVMGLSCWITIGCLLHQAQHSLCTLGDDLTDRCVP